jgi:hypothetical protein
VIVCLFCYAYIAERKSAIYIKKGKVLTMEMENKYASKGVAGTGLGLGK